MLKRKSHREASSPQNSEAERVGHSLLDDFVRYTFSFATVKSILRNEALWPIRSSSRRNPARRKTSAPPSVLVTEKFDLLEPGDVVPAWKRWSPILLRPEGLYGTRPAEGGNKAAKLRAIREALRTARRVWLATDCDREGQLIGQEILVHYKYRGQVMRVMFTAQDSQTIRDAFGRAKPNSEYARLYAAAVARRQADQIYNLSLTRTATVILGQGARRVIGVGRVKTPTLAIVCKRELEIRNFVPLAYFEVVATAKVAGGQFQMRHAPLERIVRREIAQEIADAARGFEGALTVRVGTARKSEPMPCTWRSSWRGPCAWDVGVPIGYIGPGTSAIARRPGGAIHYRRQTLASQGCLSRGRPPGR
jgi:DNA topoisomerase-3